MFWGFKRVYRGAAPAADREATRAEAHVDFLEAQNAALRALLADRDQQLQLAGILVFYWRARAERARAGAADLTVVIPASRFRRPWRSAKTEVFRR